MSTTRITAERVNEVRNHPDADRLDIIQVLGYQVVVGRDQFKVGDCVVYFPPDIMIPTEVSEELGVTNYLKHSEFPHYGKIQCRVGACRLRGAVSHGFVAPVKGAPLPFGTDLTDQYAGVKYIAPVRVTAGDAAPESHFFQKYTSIENYQHCPDVLNGQEVVITEKIHGTNCRVGYVDNVDGEGHQFVAGSHNVARKSGLYWEPLTDDVKTLLYGVSQKNGGGNVVLYGEIFGTGVQDMDYGQTGRSFRAFDISVDGKYMDHEDFQHACEHFGVETVPVLYRGPYSKEVVEEYTYGPTTFDGVRCKFKGREGCVIRPVKETLDNRGNRLILKSVSADYRDRRGAKDIGE